MDVYTFIKQLSIKERDQLAEQIGTSRSYLNFTCSVRKNLSVAKSEAILHSCLNKALPSYRKYVAKEHTAFAKAKTKSRIA